MLRGLGLLIALCVVVGDGASAQNFITPAVVYSSGSKHDKGINESMARGISRFAMASQTSIAEYEPADPSQFEPALRQFAKTGRDPIIALGGLQAQALEAVAKEFPNTTFTLVDAQVDLPNVRSMLFKEHEGSFLVGIAAAMASKTGKIGFVGGMDIPLIHRFQCGFELGIKYANPRAELIAVMTGTTPAAWNDPKRGAELAKSQFDRGVDVIYAAAGGTGIGVLQAAKDRGKYAIGVDTNQNYLFPGTMLTSMVKRFDSAAYETLAIAMAGRWHAGTSVLGLKENSVDWAVDQYNDSLITEDMRSKVNSAKSDIISDRLVVHDYLTDKTCKK